MYDSNRDHRLCQELVDDRTGCGYRDVYSSLSRSFMENHNHDMTTRTAYGKVDGNICEGKNALFCFLKYDEVEDKGEQKKQNTTTATTISDNIILLIVGVTVDVPRNPDWQ